MFYPFPEIRHIDDVLPHIDGRDEFIVARRDFYTVINYNVIFNDTFPEVTDRTSAIRRECRGIVFRNDNGEILSRRLHKFFNLNERPETQSMPVISRQKNNGFRFIEKRDGSMITPLIDPDGGYVHWATKMGVTDHSAQVKEFVKDNRHIYYDSFANYMRFCDYTPIFEYTAPDNRIVVPYDEPSLVLLHIRHNVTGKYVSYEQLIALAKNFNVPVVDLWNNGPVFYVDHFAETINKISNIEGYILTFDNGHMVKIKTDEYRQIHKAKDKLLLQKNVIRMILEENLDDVLPHISEDDGEKYITLRDKVSQGIVSLSVRLTDFVENNRHLTIQEFAPLNKKTNGIWADICFRLYRNDILPFDAMVKIRDTMLRYTSTETELKVIEFIWK